MRKNWGKFQKLPVDVTFIVGTVKEVTREVTMVEHCRVFDWLTYGDSQQFSRLDLAIVGTSSKYVLLFLDIFCQPTSRAIPQISALLRDSVQIQSEMVHFDLAL